MRLPLPRLRGEVVMRSCWLQRPKGGDDADGPGRAATTQNALAPASRCPRIGESDPKSGEIANVARRQFEPVGVSNTGDLEIS